MKKYSCMNCSYVYNPFVEEEGVEIWTSFDDIDESWQCPHCGEGKDMFTPIFENVQTVSSLASLTSQEECHIPFYRRANGKISVMVWTEENPHPTEDGHFIEYVGIFDDDQEIIDIRLQPEDHTVVFDDNEADEFEVLSSCNIHGIWKGILILK